MEKILVVGDSFTDPNFVSMKYPNYKHSFTWTDALNGNVTNIAKSGMGNPIMISRVLHEIYTNKKNKPDRVIIALSCWSRFSLPTLFDYTVNPANVWYISRYNSDTEFPNIQASYNKMLKAIEPHLLWPEMSLAENIAKYMEKNIKYFIDSTALQLINLAIVCEHMGIKLHVFQMLDPMSGPTKVIKLFEDALIKSDLFLDLSSRKVDLIGYPWVEDAGGKTVNRFLKSIESEPNKLRVGIKDAHPNADGHKKIGEWFNENYSDYKI